MRNFTFLFAAAALGTVACSHHEPVQTLPPPPDFSVEESAAIASASAASTGDTPISPDDVVFFETDSATLDASSKMTLATIAAWMERHPDRVVVLEGHADPTGPEDYNLDLSLARAHSVRAYLWMHGVPYENVIVVGRGETRVGDRPGDVARRVVVFATAPADTISVR